MGFYINAGFGYYEGDQISPLDQEVPQRPLHTCVWNGSDWVAVSPTKAERIGAVNAEYAASLAAFDKAWTAVNRAGGASLATKIAAIQSDSAALKAQRDADITAIRNS